MTTKRNHGPWRVYTDPNGCHHVITAGTALRNSDCIASAYTKERAQLIAAAPDLLEALKTLFILVDGYSMASPHNPHTEHALVEAGKLIHKLEGGE